MRRRGEDRIIQQVFPIPGEGPARDDDRRLRRLDPAGAGDDDWRLLYELLRRPNRHRLDRQHFGGAQQTESRDEIDADHVGAADLAVSGRDFGAHRLSDQVANGDNQTGIIDDHP